MYNKLGYQTSLENVQSSLGTLVLVAKSEIWVVVLALLRVVPSVAGDDERSIDTLQ